MNSSNEPKLIDMDLKQTKILHIGNIANNAYLAGLADRSLGLNSFVLSVDYTHVMGFPFWEQETLEIDRNQHFQGNSLQSKYSCPEWFIYGTWDEAINKLENQLSVKPTTRDNKRIILFRVLMTRIIRLLVDSARPAAKKLFPDSLNTWIANTWLVRVRKVSNPGIEIRIQKILDLFDIVVFYGPSNALIRIYNLAIREYISFEHGTLRDFIWTDYSWAKESRIGYEKSTFIMVSNQDNYDKALALMNGEVCRVIRTPHPVSEVSIKELRQLRKTKLSEIKRNKEILFPARHSYGKDIDVGKGFDYIIRAIELLVSDRTDVRFCFVEWGEHVHLTKKFLEDKKLDKYVSWSPLKSRMSLKKKMATSYAVVDQFIIPAYGAIVSDALSVGTLVISKKNDDLDIGHFGSQSPVVGFDDLSELIERLTYITMDDFNLSESIDKATEWYDLNLAEPVSSKIRLDAYRRLLEAKRKLV